MAQRSVLHSLLKTLADNVYFQPPSGHQLNYPCIVYKRDRANTLFADNIPYRYKKRYQVTVIDRNPDSLIPDSVALLPTCTHQQSFVNENLNHEVFDLFF